MIELSALGVVVFVLPVLARASVPRSPTLSITATHPRSIGDLGENLVAHSSPRLLTQPEQFWISANVHAAVQVRGTPWNVADLARLRNVADGKRRLGFPSATLTEVRAGTRNYFRRNFVVRPPLTPPLLRYPTRRALRGKLSQPVGTLRLRQFAASLTDVDVAIVGSTMPTVLPWYSLPLAALLMVPGRAYAFDYFEHRWIGDVACASALKTNTYDCTELTVTQAPERTITFGDLVALAGDHFKDPKDMVLALADYRTAALLCEKGDCARLNSTRLAKILVVRQFQLRGVRQWLNGTGRPDQFAECEIDGLDWLQPSAAGKTITGCMAALTKTIDAIHEVAREPAPPAPPTAPPPGSTMSGDCYEPSAAELNEFSASPKYAMLAAANYNHFGGDTVRAWERKRDALRHADFGNPANRVLLAFALHHLTDAFASGHIRTPRRVLSNPEAKREHDFDSVVGLFVMARVGPKGGQRYIEWQAFGDRCLLGLGADNHRAVTTVAVVASIEELIGSSGAPSITPPELAETFGADPHDFAAMRKQREQARYPRNGDVPNDGRYFSLTLGPATSGIRDVDGNWGAALALRLVYKFSAASVYDPPALAQSVTYGSNRALVLVPISIDEYDTVMWLLTLASRGNQLAVNMRRVLNQGGPLSPFALHFWVGLALTKSVSQSDIHAGVYQSISVEYKVYDQWSLSLFGDIALASGAGLQAANVGIRLGVDL